jgi:hypothetical protein
VHEAVDFLAANAVCDMLILALYIYLPLLQRPSPSPKSCTHRLAPGTCSRASFDAGQGVSISTATLLVHQITAHRLAILLWSASTEDRLCHHYTPETLGHIDAVMSSNKADHGGLGNVEQPTPDMGMAGMARAVRIPSCFGVA